MDDRLRKLLSNPYRVIIIKSIGVEGSTFSEIKKKTGLSTGTIYHHINVMSDLIYKERRKYYLSKSGKKVYSLLESGEFFLDKYKEPIINLDIVIKVLFLSKLFKLLYESRMLPILSGILGGVLLYSSVRYNVGFILFRPINRPIIPGILLTISSLITILSIYTIHIYFSVGTEFSWIEWLNLWLIAFIPLAVLATIPFLFYMLYINNKYLFSIIQFIAAFYLAIAMSVSSGLKIDRSLAVSGFLLFIGQIIG
jgi:DNA-binding HxlR family transcriptional regulator